MYITAEYFSKTDFVSYFEIWVLQVNERNIVGILKLDLDSKISKKKKKFCFVEYILHFGLIYNVIKLTRSSKQTSGK